MEDALIPEVNEVLNKAIAEYTESKKGRSTTMADRIEDKPIAVEDNSLKVSNAARDLMKFTGMSFVDARSRVLESIERNKTMSMIKSNAVEGSDNA